MGAMVAADARVVAIKINAWAQLADTATTAHLKMTDQCGQCTSIDETPEWSPMTAATTKIGVASAATLN